MSDLPPADRPSADAREVAEAIRHGWIARGFKLGIGFFLAGVVVWLIPLFLLASCVGGLAAIGGAAALKQAAEAVDAPAGVVESPAPPTDADTADASRVAADAAADTAATQ
jgi:hypothetical protein